MLIMLNRPEKSASPSQHQSVNMAEMTPCLRSPGLGLWALLSRVWVLGTLLQTAVAISGSRNARYDKSINLFSPDGDLLQVGYAEIAGERGSTVVCVPSSDNSLLLCLESDPKLDILADRRLLEKVSKIDDGIWLTFSGLAGDGRAVIRSARSFCGSYRMNFGCSPTVSAVAHHLGKIQHRATLAGNERPLGVHTIVCGFDDSRPRPRIFSTRASGTVSAWKAFSIGRGADKAIELLESRLEPSIQNSTDNCSTSIGSAINGTKNSEEDQLNSNSSSSAATLAHSIAVAVDAMEAAGPSALPHPSTTSSSSAISSDGSSSKAQDILRRRQYDLFHLKYDVRGLPIVAVTSVAKGDDYTKLTWRRRQDVNNNNDHQQKHGEANDKSKQQPASL